LANVITNAWFSMKN